MNTFGLNLFGGGSGGFTSFNIEVGLLAGMDLIDVEIDDSDIEVIIDDGVDVIVNDDDIEVEVS